MQFVYPAFLWGLLLTLIPLIIHLFRLRRFKIVFFSNNELLRNIQLETRKKSRIKHLIILILRMLSVAAVIIAFAQPFIPRDTIYIGSQNEHIALIYVDNSFSMQIGESYHTNLEEAKKIVREIMKGFSSTDRFILLTNEFLASSYRPITSLELQKQIVSVGICSRTRHFHEVISRMRDIYEQLQHANVTGFIISDFQKTFMSELNEVDSLQFPLFFIPVQTNKMSNIGIDSVWLDSPAQLKGQAITVNAVIQNYSSDIREKVPVELYVNGLQKAISTVDLGPNQISSIEMSFTPTEFGIHNCKVIIQDSPLTYDDVFYFSFIVSEHIHVYVLTQHGKTNNSLQKLFNNDELFIFNTASAFQRNFEQMTNANLLILDGVEEFSSGLIQEIVSFTADGGSLVIIPPVGMKTNFYNPLMLELTQISYGEIISAGLRMSKLNLQHNLFKGVFDGVPRDMDFPFVKKYFALQIPASSLFIPLIMLQNDEVFLFQSVYKNGYVYVFSAPFDNDYTSFHRHSLFVPVLYQMALLSSRFEKPYYTIGSREMIEISGVFDGQNNRFRITDTENSMSVIPEVRLSGRSNMLNTHNQIDSAGNYMLLHNDSLIAAISMNYNRDESDLRFYNNLQLDSIASAYGIVGYEIMYDTKRIEVDVKEHIQGRKLWKLFLYIALTCLALEVLLLRFWK